MNKSTNTVIAMGGLALLASSYAYLSSPTNELAANSVNSERVSETVLATPEVPNFAKPVEFDMAKVSDAKRLAFAELDAAVRSGEADPSPDYWEQRAAIERADLAELAVLNGEQPADYLLNSAASVVGSDSTETNSIKTETADATSTSDSGEAKEEELDGVTDPISSQNSIARSMIFPTRNTKTGSGATETTSAASSASLTAVSQGASTAANATTSQESRTPRENIADERETVRDIPEPDSPIATPSSKIVFTSPVSGSSTNFANVLVEGSVELERNLDSVTINGQAVNWRSGTFSANIALEEGFNTITAEADYGRRKHSAEVNVILDRQRPTMISALSTSTFSALVQFSESMNAGSLNVSNFSIVREDTSAVLPVLGATFTDATTTTIALDTGMQSNVEYTLIVGNVKDLAGNPILDQQAEVSQNTAETEFVGTVATGADLQRDTDGDGLTDYVELQGWPVIITRTDGTLENKIVFSDPLLADTDSDLIPDSEERHGGMDPRNPDTDGDTLNDDSEWNRVYSDPTNQDTDGDGIQDGFEYLFFKTSPIFADTDGDQIDDPTELVAGNRSPLIADLPSPDISVGNVNLQLDTRFTFTDEAGATNTQSKTVEATLSQSENDSFSTSNEASTKNTLNFSQSLSTTVSKEVKAGVPPKAKVSASITATVGSEQGSEKGSTNTFGEESSRASEEAYHDSLTLDVERDTRESITREVLGASMKVDLSVANAGDIPFTVSNLELTAQVQDPRNRRRLIPVASLTPENESLGSVNIGVLGDTARGPFVFTSSSVFPQEVQDLMKNPRGLVVQLANFDIIDEDGNNFAFSSQRVLDRTAGITFDLGDGRVESYRVATASEHDANTGLPIGISMARALEIVGLNRYATIRDGGNGISESVAGGDDVQVILPSRPVPGSSVEPKTVVVSAGPGGQIDAATVVGGDDVLVPADYETEAFRASEAIVDGGNGIAETAVGSGDDVVVSALNSPVSPGQVVVRSGPDGLIDSDPGGDDIKLPGGVESNTLVRFRDVSASDTEFKFWVLYSPTDVTGIDLDDFQLRSGQQYDFAYVQDQDLDGVWAREEYLHGTSDLAANSDGCDLASPPTPCDTISDFDEIRTGWRVQLKSSPQSYLVYPNPNQADSDRDGILDDVELVCGLDPRQRDTDFDGLSDREEIFGIRINGADISDMVSVNLNDSSITPFRITRYLGATPTLPVEFYAPLVPPSFVPHTLTPECAAAIGVEGYATDPLDEDTDGDFVNDLTELSLGLHPNDKNDGASFLDDDGDGLPNSLENQTRNIFINGSGIPVQVTSNPNKADSDDDKLPDLLEFYLGSNPNNPDTDGDGILDTDEYKNGGAVCIGAPSVPCATFLNKPTDDFNAFVSACNEADACDVSTIEGAGTFGLGNERQLGTNINHNDTDGDGLRDNIEVSSRSISVNGGTNNVAVTSDPFVVDTDDDGVNDNSEFLNGTNPRNGNTDGDSQGDFYEIVTDTGRDPANRDKRVRLIAKQMYMNANSTFGSVVAAVSNSPMGRNGALITGSKNCEGTRGTLADGLFATQIRSGANYVEIPGTLLDQECFTTVFREGSTNTRRVYIASYHRIVGSGIGGFFYTGGFYDCFASATINDASTTDGAIIQIGYPTICDFDVYDFGLGLEVQVE